MSARGTILVCSSRARRHATGDAAEVDEIIYYWACMHHACAWQWRQRQRQEGLVFLSGQIVNVGDTHTHDTTHRGGVVGSSSRVEIVFNLNPATPGRRRADLVVCTAPTCGGQLLPRSRTAFHHEWQMKSLYSVAEPETEIEFSPGVVTYRGDWKIRMHRSISRRAVVAIATRPRHQHQACKLNR